MAAVTYPSEHMSDPERLLWFQICVSKLARPIYGHRFDRKRRWKVDFAYVDMKIAIEVEGIGRSRRDKKTKIETKLKRCPTCGQEPLSDHRTVDGFERNIEKYNELRMQGWLHLQFTPAMVKRGEALKAIERALSQVQISRCSSSSTKGEQLASASYIFTLPPKRR